MPQAQVQVSLFSGRIVPAICFFLISAFQATPQVCRLSVAGLNQSRKVMGPVNSECPTLFHSAPFGNWGVSSNFGSRQDGRQFDGWCHDTYFCDNAGACRTDCRDGWYEWNSCTDNPAYRAPNCSLYNSTNCTEQVSTTGINVHGTQIVDIPVRCPADSDGNGGADQGGCREITGYSHGTNFMTLYELDLGRPDLVQTMYFPETRVDLKCGVWGCAPAISAWTTPSFYDSPSSPPKVYAEMAMIVNSAVFVDTSRGCRVSGPTATTVSAASFNGPAVAIDSITSAFGEGLATSTASARALPLPTSLAATALKVTDTTGAERLAPLFYVSPGQINYLIPSGTAPGPATLAIARSDGILATGSLQIVPVAPGLFSANADGRGVAAAVAIRISADGSRVSQPIFECGAVPNACVPQPIDLGAETDLVVLQLFGTGIRHRRDLAAVRVELGGEPAVAQYAGPQGQFVGLDQVNVALPRNLKGRGEVPIVLTVEGASANVVTARF